MNNTIVHVLIKNKNDWKIAYLIDRLLEENGCKLVGAGSNGKVRDMNFEWNSVEDYSPEPIKVNLPFKIT